VISPQVIAFSRKDKTYFFTYVPITSQSSHTNNGIMTDNLTSKTLHGLKWSYISTLTKSVLQIGFTAIMARLLEPAAFGLIAMAGVILRFGSYFAQMGVGSALIQKKEISDEDVRAAFTSALFLGVLFCVSVWFLAPLAIYIFDSERVIPIIRVIIRVMALSFIITGLTTTALSLLRRNLEFRSLAVTEIVSYVLGYGLIGITLAFCFHAIAYPLFIGGNITSLFIPSVGGFQL